MQPTSPDLSQTRLQLVRPLFDANVRVCVRDPRGPQPDPLPAEAAGVSTRAVEKRRREFAAGRTAARQAMRELGVTEDPIPVGGTRAPVWPTGIVGSITHTQSCAMAVVAKADDYAGLGLDVEEDTPLKPDLWDAICSEREQAWLHQQGSPGQMGKLIFSAKEAAYKCQYAVSQKYYGFDGMELDIDTENRRFLARFTADQFPFSEGDEIAGRYAIGAGVILTAATLPRKVVDSFMQVPQ